MSKANYDLPDDKLKKVVRLSGAKSKKEALIIVMDSYLQQQKAQALVKARGTLPLDWTKKSLRQYRG